MNFKVGDLVTPCHPSGDRESNKLWLLERYAIKPGTAYEVIRVKEGGFPQIVIRNDKGIKIGPLDERRFKRVVK